MYNKKNKAPKKKRSKSSITYPANSFNIKDININPYKAVICEFYGVPNIKPKKNRHI